MGQGTSRVREGEAHGNLVNLVLIDRHAVVQNQETGEILLVGFDAFGKHFKAV